jgi:hypothetical protein
MIRQILPNNNEKCYSTFSPNFSPTEHTPDKIYGEAFAVLSKKKKKCCVVLVRPHAASRFAYHSTTRLLVVLNTPHADNRHTFGGRVWALPSRSIIKKICHPAPCPAGRGLNETMSSPRHRPLVLVFGWAWPTAPGIRLPPLWRHDGYPSDL